LLCFGTHINNTESRWHALKKSLWNTALQKVSITVTLPSSAHAKKYTDNAADKFLAVWKLIRLVYNPNCSDNIETKAAEPHHDNRKQLSTWINITATSATAPPETSLQTADIGNFDKNLPT